LKPALLCVFLSDAGAGPNAAGGFETRPYRTGLSDSHICIVLLSVMAGSAAGRLPAIHVFVSFAF
jgi:hypothetical protein